MSAETPLPSVALVDPSLFTEPYDAALDGGLAAIGISPVWAVRPTRRGQRALLPPSRTRAIFYRRVDDDRLIPPWLRKPAKALSHIIGLWRLVRIVGRERIDVVHLQWAVIPILDALAIWIFRRRAAVVVTVHDTTPFNGDRLGVLQHLGFDLPARLADFVIVHTEGGRGNLASRGINADRICVVPHGPLQFMLPPDERLPRPAIRDPRHTFTMFGQIKPYKGVDVLIEAIARMPAASRAASRFLVAGAAMTDTMGLEARAQELGLEDVLEFRLGRLSEPQMDALFDETDTFVFPYRAIDASGVYYTVRPLRKWIVASRVGAFAEDFVEGRDGRTVPPGDVDTLAAALVAAPAEQANRHADPVGDPWPDIALKTLEAYRAALFCRASRGENPQGLPAEPLPAESAPFGAHQG